MISDRHPTTPYARARQALRRVARWMLLVPVLLFATVSQGTMVEAAAEGGWRIVLCTGDGMVEAIMTADGQVRPVDGPGQDDPAAEPPCAWALHGQSVLAGDAVGIDPPLILQLATVYAVEIPLHLRRVDVLTPAARGPPAII